MSISVRPAGTSPWRFIVIAAVGVLAVGIGVAAGSFLLTARQATVGSAAAYVPADAAYYFEMRLEPSSEQDAALRELLGPFPPIEGVDLDAPLHDQVVEHLDQMLAAEDAGVSWSDDVAPWFDGHLAVAVTDIPVSAMEMPEDPTAMPEVPPTVVLLGVTDAAAAQAAIDRIVAASESDVTFTETEHAGVTVYTVEGSENGAYALTDDQLIVGTDAEAINASLDAHASGDGTLAEKDEITRLTDTLPEDWLAFATYDMTDLLAEAVAAGASASPEMADAFGELLAHQPLRGAMAISASGDRMLLDAATDAPTGPFAVSNEDRGLADEVPNDALYYSEAGNLGAAFAAVIGPLKDALATTPEAAEGISTAEAALGADLEELVSWMGDGAIAVGYDGSEPYGGMVIVPTDVELAERRLGQLASFANLGAMDPSSGVSVDESDVDGTTVTTVTWNDPNAGSGGMMPGPTGVSIQYAVTDDRALIGIGETFVQRVLQLESGSSLADESRYTDAVAEFGGAENAGVVWLDVTGTREAVEAALGPMIGAFDTEGSYESDVRPWLLPLDRIVSVARLDGDVLIQRGALLVE